MNIKKEDWNAIIIALYTKMEKDLKASKKAWLNNNIVDTRFKASDVSNYLKLTMKIINLAEKKRGEN